MSDQSNMPDKETQWKESTASLLSAFISLLYYFWFLVQLIFFYTKWRINRMSSEDNSKKKVTISEIDLAAEIGAELLRTNAQVRELFIESMSGLRDYAKTSIEESEEGETVEEGDESEESEESEEGETVEEGDE